MSTHFKGCILFVPWIYSVRVNVLNVIVLPPVFITHPSSQSVNLTQTPTFTCSATGNNVSYEWTIGSGSFPSKVTGINTNTLVIPDVRSSDDNTYTCVASSEGGSVSSNIARLTVTGMTMMLLCECCIGGTGLPEVIVSPSSLSVEVTHTAMFTTTVSGVGVENFMYQWRHNGTIITGETRDTLMITNVMESDSGDYESIVTNEYGDCVTSNISELSKCMYI